MHFGHFYSTHLDGDRAHLTVLQVSYEGAGAAGWESPALVPWLSAIVEKTSQTYYHKSALYQGEVRQSRSVSICLHNSSIQGGSIPFMGMLGKRYPKAQFVITGVLGPQSNAHGPNEFLHIDFAKKLTCCIAEIVAEQAKHATA